MEHENFWFDFYEFQVSKENLPIDVMMLFFQDSLGGVLRKMLYTFANLATRVKWICI